MSSPSTRKLSLALTCVLLAAAAPSRGEEPRASPESAPERRPDRPPAPRPDFSALPVADVTVDLTADLGPFEPWRHAIGHGGINAAPLPDRVVAGISRLRPRRIRVFIQEFFRVYPERDRLDWSRLDPYMDALARTGATVVAAITIKPKPLYPAVDQRVWRPNDVAEWQRVVAALARRYSVEKRIVSHWEIGNETDIGEHGGCPYLIPDPRDYAEHYKMTIQPILEAAPDAKVGGAAVANAGGDYLQGFIERCLQEKIRLDFVSWHLYSDDPEHHARLVERYRKLLERFGGRAPEMMVTEWSKGFDAVSVEEMAFDPRRAAAVASCLMAMTDARLDWSFYYHAWDQVCYLDDFKPFFQDPDIMYRHWNEAPHRFGLFGVGGEVRPQYFVFDMLARMGGRRARVRSDAADLRALAARDGGWASLMIASYGRPASQDRIAAIRWSGLSPGRKRLLAYRIDGGPGWSAESLELTPRESREVDVKADFSCQVYCAADSVSLVLLEEVR